MKAYAFLLAMVISTPCVTARADTTVKITPASTTVRVVPEPITPPTRQVFEFTCGRAHYAVTFDMAPAKRSHILSAITVNGTAMRENIFQAAREALSGEDGVLSVQPVCYDSNVTIKMALDTPTPSDAKNPPKSLSQVSLEIKNPPL
ncbi:MULTISPECIES: hypothetical protein [Nitrospirillum]|uniref:Uncharacterized protein n=1 Tax=Nitrospirillum amazonense TaxID=28077 RepID=A0A560F680_9PROT|nr:hypothetical protein [Nitrospirillum amazonense]MEC4590598.1 hypothetical protein [Nitrospirillum amazonense]TWB17122.1 hypothetical protein FBZ88_12649 [Nitrospirillum amazonense]